VFLLEFSDDYDALDKVIVLTLPVDPLSAGVAGVPPELEPEPDGVEAPSFAQVASVPFGNTFSGNRPMKFPWASQYLQTTYTPEIPHPSLVEDFHTTCVKWPIPLEYPGLLKSYPGLVSSSYHICVAMLVVESKSVFECIARFSPHPEPEECFI